MDDHAHLPTGTDAPVSASPPMPRGDDALPADGQAAARGRAAQPSLPFDEAADHPIPFSLTARARRVVAPQALPPLTVVPSAPTPAPPRQGGALVPRPDRDEDDQGGVGERPGDTRPARARAMRRAGMGPAAIARKLQVDELFVRAWIGDAASSPITAPPPPTEPELQPADHDDATGYALVRAAATEEARSLIQTDAAFAAGLGLVAAVAAIDCHAATFATTRAELAGRIVAWLRDRADLDPGSLRVVLRLGTGVAGDLARHHWAQALAVPVASVVYTRWHQAPAPDAVEALVRIPDPTIAATLAGWCDALLTPVDGPLVDPSF